MTLARAVERLLIGTSLTMRQLRHEVMTFAPHNVAVLIEGPTGSGKELVAQALHLTSRRTGSLVSVNMCAIPPETFESELFGHVQGSFTGAIRDRGGLFSEGDRGTVFLDEVGGLPRDLQAKLLRVIETKRFRAVGGSREQASDFRVLAAANEPLDGEVLAGRFRQDLFFRLRALRIQVPTLAARREDIAALAEHFLAEDWQLTSSQLKVDALAVLERYDWPGNVRELRHVLGAARLRAASGVISADDIRAVLVDHAGGDTEVLRRDAGRLGLMGALERNGWSIQAAAAELGIDRTTVYRRLRRLGIARSMASQNTM